MGLVKVKKIYANNSFIGAVDGTVDCAQLNGAPQIAWLIRDNRRSAVFPLKISTTDPKLARAIKGVLLSEDTDNPILVDGTLTDFVAKCSACCGSDITVVPVYNGVYPVLQEPIAKSYSIARPNSDGSGQAYNRFNYDYAGQIIDKTLTNTFNSGTKVATYTFQAYSDPKLTGADVLTETARVFNSNVIAALGGAETKFVLASSIDGGVNPAIEAATLAALAIAAAAAYPSAGVFTVEGGNTLRLTSTSVDTAVFTISKA